MTLLNGDSEGTLYPPLLLCSPRPHLSLSGIRLGAAPKHAFHPPLAWHVGVLVWLRPTGILVTAAAARMTVAAASLFGCGLLESSVHCVVEAWGSVHGMVEAYRIRIFLPVTDRD